jgi:hypothetical protein
MGSPDINVRAIAHYRYDKENNEQAIYAERFGEITLVRRRE